MSKSWIGTAIQVISPANQEIVWPM